MVKVEIKMDQTWCWWPEKVEGSIFNDITPTMEVPEALMERYKKVTDEYFALNAELEQLYRKQRGMPLYDQPALPEHRMIDELGTTTKLHGDDA